MTSNTSALSDGTYIAGNSSNAGAGEEAFRAFDKNNNSVWTSTVSRYNKSTGAYVGAVTTTMSSVSYSGEWLQLQIPYMIILRQYTLTSHPSTYGRSPVTFYLGGSNDGSTWDLLDTETNVSWSQSAQTSKTFYINTTNSYNYYRIVSNSVLGTNNGGVHSFNAYLSFAEVVIDGVSVL